MKRTPTTFRCSILGSFWPHGHGRWRPMLPTTHSTSLLEAFQRCHRRRPSDLGVDFADHPQVSSLLVGITHLPPCMRVTGASPAFDVVSTTSKNSVIPYILRRNSFNRHDLLYIGRYRCDVIDVADGIDAIRSINIDGLIAIYRYRSNNNDRSISMIYNDRSIYP